MDEVQIRLLQKDSLRMGDIELYAFSSFWSNHWWNYYPNNISIPLQKNNSATSERNIAETMEFSIRFNFIFYYWLF